VLAASITWLLHLRTKNAEPEAEPVAIETNIEASPTTDAAPSTPSDVATAVKPNDGGKVPVKDRATSASSAPASERVPAAATPTTPVARGKVRLQFSFTQESWVEVYDSHNTRMLYDVGNAGQTRGVDVDPPAQIVLGNASAVTTAANGREVTVPPRRVVNQVARFTVGADGAAQ
jgi:cytoskeleton protein RodZ